MADVFGDGRQAYYTHRTNGEQLVTRFVSAAPDLLTGITSGSGVSTTLTYASLANGAAYTKDSGAAYPVADVKSPVQVVSSVSESNGAGGTVQTSYAYTGAKSHQQGGGFLGFRKVEATAHTGVKNMTTFRQDYPFQGLPLTAQTSVASTGSPSVVLKNASYVYGCTNPANGSACSVAPGNRYFPFVSQAVESGNDLDGAALPTVTTSTQYDSHGNATTVAVSTGDGHSKMTTNVYTNDVPSWLLGRLKSSTVQSTAQ
jgi:hypothetical protein